MCYNLGKVTENVAKRIAIELNETKFPNDLIKLAEIIKDINTDFDIDDMVKSIPFTKEEIEYFISSLDIDFTPDVNNKDKTKEKVKEANNSMEDLKCPKCGFKWKMDAKSLR